LTPTYRFYVRKSQYKTKLKEFVDIYDQFLTLNPNKKNFKIIDLRYPTGFAVQ
jgi:cell division septal protein FtsQ